ncbi:MAG: amidohydrolase, partial [SAR202 cluster bacterium]|nr:amidohydrolase [SAR202 cluster bacterium]
MNKTIFYSSLLVILSLSCQNSYTTSDLDLTINKHQQKFEQLALQIWDIAEMGYQEYKSSNLLKEALSEEGFRIQNNVANIPTAFIAEYGSGFPVIAILGEFDALPGISQSASP